MASDDNTPFSLEALAPNITNLSVVENLLQDKYGLITTSVTALNGFDDKNFCVKVKEDIANPYVSDICGKEFFVKIVNSKDSKQPEFVDNQRRVMEHLNKHGITCQEEIRNLDGKYFSRIAVDKNGVSETCMVSVRTFLPGAILASKTLTSSLLFELGVYLAKIHRALESFHEDFYDDFDCTWSLNNMNNVRLVIHAVKDLETRKVVLDILDSFDMDVLPKRGEFRKSQIHGDPNEQNILITSDDTSSSGFTVCGLLDFQDTCRTHPVYDLAILIAYMMMIPKDKTSVSPVDVGGYVLAGYGKWDKVNHSEWACLRTLIACRMVMSLVYGAYTFMQDPNNEYLITTAKNGWSVMTEFWGTAKDVAEQRWEEIKQNYEPSHTHEL